MMPKNRFPCLGGERIGAFGQLSEKEAVAQKPVGTGANAFQVDFLGLVAVGKYDQPTPLSGKGPIAS
jgi:hypothetical protein